MLYPTTNFQHANSLNEAVDYAENHYKRFTYVCEASSHHNIPNCARVNVPISDAVSKAKQLATKGLFEEFRKLMPPSMRQIDSRHLMNDMRESMDCDIIKEPLQIQTNDIREQYFKGEIYNVGDIVECVKTGQLLEITKRGTNNLICKAESGVVNKWLHEVKAKSTSQNT